MSGASSLVAGRQRRTNIRCVQKVAGDVSIERHAVVRCVVIAELQMSEEVAAVQFFSTAARGRPAGSRELGALGWAAPAAGRVKATAAGARRPDGRGHVGRQLSNADGQDLHFPYFRGVTGR
jgi:hypothetical protein